MFNSLVRGKELAMSEPAKARGVEMKTREYAVRICDGCIRLDGKVCNTPECAFCRKATEEIAKLLEACQLRYVVDGEIIELHESAVVNREPLEN